MKHAPEKKIVRFRAWDTEKQCWLNWTNHEVAWSISPCGMIILEQDDDGGKSGLHEHTVNYAEGKFVLEQFTGLQDRRNVEIYEGDVCLQHKLQGSIIFTDATFILDAGEHGHWHLAELSDIEVIGNIHENPELLKPSV